MSKGLTLTDVAEIRSEYEAGVPAISLAQWYRVSEDIIFNILHSLI